MFIHDKTAIVFAAVLATIICSGAVVLAQSKSGKDESPKPSIVLVHGAYADGTSWSKVIALLQAKGFNVVSVQNPTTSLADDVAATERVINQRPGMVVLAGHSWAGVVITQAGNNPKVKALVYVDASAPDAGQSILDAAAAMPSAPGASAGVKDENGYLLLPEAAVRQYFAQDLSHADQGIIAATQTPWAIGCLTDKVTKAAWREKPSWWVIGEFDNMINPKLQEKMAATLKAKVTKVKTGHLAMLADPKAVTDVIIDAAKTVESGRPADGAISYKGPAANDTVLIVPVSFTSPPEAGLESARAIRGPAGVVPVSGELAAKLIIDPPLADSLAAGRVVIQYRAENVRIEQVFGRNALDVSPRIGHIHVTIDDLPWHWLDASGEPLTITGLPEGKHKVLIELVNAAHQTLDYGVVSFNVPIRSLTQNDPKADGFRRLPELR